jgi:CheY-like chemotaxis protein
MGWKMIDLTGPLSKDEKANLTQKKLILAVDDAVEYLRVVAKALGYRYDLVLAKSGAEAMRILAQQMVDLILLDIEMPGMSGLELFNLIKTNPVYGTVPVILVTSHTQSDLINQAIELGAKGYIVKPFKETTLIDKITQALNTSPGKMAAVRLSRQLINIESCLIKIQKLLAEGEDPLIAFEKTLDLRKEAVRAFLDIVTKNSYSSAINVHLNRIYAQIKNEDNQVLPRIKEFIDDLDVRDLAAGP